MPDALTNPLVPETAKKTDKKKPGFRDPFREALDTVVFVVVLVFLLKQFVVEAFVIPTGSMAETLYGYQKEIRCAECGHDFALNSSVEVDPQDERDRRYVQGYCCPNCRYKYDFKDDERLAGKVPYNASGDRVLVNKWEYHAFAPERGDVVVFKFPEKPQTQFSAQNYIKRMWGLGGETLAIWRGDLYITTDLTYPADKRNEEGDLLYPRPDRKEDLWKGNPMQGPDYRYTNAREALELFESSKQAGFPADKPGFKLVRKTDRQLNEMKRLVYDNDHQSQYLAGKNVPPRWTPVERDSWLTDNPTMPKVFTHKAGTLSWIKYRHIIVDDFDSLAGPASRPDIKPTVVDNFLGYNGEVGSTRNFVLDRGFSEDHKFWVGDLIVECRAKLGEANAEVVLELGKGPNRFQARFASGEVSLIRTGPMLPGEKAEIGKQKTKITSAGSYTLRFANVDGQLSVWVDGRKIDFGTTAHYSPVVPTQVHPNDLKHEGWTEADRTEPVKIGASGNVELSKLKIWRDTYFINRPYASTNDVLATVDTYFVHPGHYLCLGDNSAQSSDSRVWGVVPERLMLGKASFVFFPLDRIGFIK